MVSILPNRQVKKYFFFLACILLSSCTSCKDIGKLVDKQKSSSYFIDSKGKVVYCQNGNWFSLGVLQMQADTKSFEVLAEDIGKDKDSVYFRNMTQKLVDKNHIYYNQEIVPDADVKTFIPIGRDFGKDTKNVYYQKQRLEGVDAASFKKDGDFYKDKRGNKFSALTGNKV